MISASRRDFLRASTLIASSLSWLDVSPARAAPAGQNPWYRHAWRRAVIDMHIADWDEQFLSRFDPQEYARALVTSKSQSIVCYAQSHVGLFNYPTKVGQQHRGLGGRNVLGEMIDQCHQHGIHVVLYTSLIFDRTTADNHPDWRMRTWEGKIQGEGGRAGVLCINSPYREYVRNFVTELCTEFDFEGLRFDMTFWPWICYCPNCQQRFAAEVGGDVPQTVNWLDEKWVAFQRARERWLVEFAEIATSTVRRHKPAASVEHQSSTYPLNWVFGVTAPLAAQNDFLQGDFYGDQLQGSFVRKLLEDLTPNRPFGYETSFSVNLRDHTAMKPAALLEAKASAAIADSAAFIFIDAIDPIGTVNLRAHQRMGNVFQRLLPYYEHLGGERVRDVAIYYSPESKFNMAGNGRSIASPDTSDAHTQSSMQVAKRLITAHLPFGVITRHSLDQLADLRVLILSNVNMMDEEECAAIREWVRGGGKLLATGGTSLVDKQGRRQADFMLADVFGASIEHADWNDRKHFLAPTDAGAELFPEFDARHPAFCTGYGFKVKAHSTARVLATTSEVWPGTTNDRFSSFHSDPPWKPTDNPELVWNTFGQGQALYSSSLIENLDILPDTFVRLVRLLHDDYRFAVEAPACVEATLFHQPDRQRYVFCLVNFQNEMPNIPIDGIAASLHLPQALIAVKRLPDGHTLETQTIDRRLTFTAPRLETLLMFAVDYT